MSKVHLLDVSPSSDSVTMVLQRNPSWAPDGSIGGTLTIERAGMLVAMFNTVERGKCLGPDFRLPSPFKPYVAWSKNFERFRWGVHPMTHSWKNSLPRVRCLRLAMPSVQANLGILVHAASGPKDLAGCLAPFKDSCMAYSSSELAMNEIWAFCGGFLEGRQNVTLVVKNDYPA